MRNLEYHRFIMKILNRVLCVGIGIYLFSSCTSTKTIPDQTTIETIEIEQPVEPTVEQILVKQEPRIYRAEKTKYFDLVHTKLEVSFDWENRYLFGKATVQLKPHFYSRGKLTLDAKGFDLHKVQLVNGDSISDLSYKYDGNIIDIELDREYSRNDIVTIFIDYTAKTYELQVGGSEAITEDRGLYFINHDGKEEGKPQQIWTQGETEANSCWFPTIDAPNQKTTQEIYITVEDRFKTLSNGELIYSQLNEDGSRTDYWKMDKPHAPYLFMMAIGEFAIVEDEWNEKLVSYYVEPEYGPYAKDIFGSTPEMMTFFSELLDYPFPWNKYSQVVVRDYVSGAMENTTASLYMDELQMTKREMLDGDYEDIIAHELMHQWFGDLVTCESWSNLTLNEGFASYGEYLWIEHNEEKADAEYKLYEELDAYLSEAEEKKVDLVRFYYDDREDMFDNHSYAKGGLILHMLRDYLGDEAFFKSLNVYLKKHEYKDVEVNDLRLAFEEVSGEDMNWFFNQWFLAKGHPQLEVSHTYIDSTNLLTIDVWQKQDSMEFPIYRLPVDVEIHNNGKVLKELVLIDSYHNQFVYELEEKPDLVLVNSDQDIVAEVSHSLSKSEWIVQASKAGNVVARLKAYEHILSDSTAQVQNVFYEGLNDPFSEIQRMSISYASENADTLVHAWKDELMDLAQNAERTEVRSDALYTLFEVYGESLTDIYEESLNDSSYLVSGTALYALLQSSETEAEPLIEKFINEENVNIVLPLANYFLMSSDTTKYDWYKHQIKSGETETQYYLLRMVGQYMMGLEKEKVDDGIDLLFKYASDDSRYYIRIAALQSLQLFEENMNAKEKLAEIKSSEKDERVLRFLN